jgi:DNA-binding NarL/FixJ family response regulator
MENNHDQSGAESCFVLYHQPSLIIDALRKAIKKRAPEFALVSTQNMREATARADLILITIPAEGALDLDGLLKPFESIAEGRPGVPVVAVLHRCDASAAARLIERKVNGIITADSSIEATVAALRYAVAGGSFAPPSLWRSAHPPQPQTAQPLTLRAETLELASHPETSFTPREIEVLHRLRQGLQNKIIAYELGISESTVKVHLRNVMKKLHASNRTQVAFMLRRLPHLNGAANAGRDYTPQ